jgi:hypothetical protein
LLWVDPIKEHLHGSMTDLIGQLHDRGDARLKESSAISSSNVTKAMLSGVVKPIEYKRLSAHRPATPLVGSVRPNSANAKTEKETE